MCYNNYVINNKESSKMLKYTEIQFTRHAAQRMNERLDIPIKTDTIYPMPNSLTLSGIRRHSITNKLQETWADIDGKFALIIDQSTRLVITVLTKEHEHLYNYQFKTILNYNKK
jgi:hypothetical protein